MRKIEPPSNNNSRESNKAFYLIVKLNEKVVNSLCVNCSKAFPIAKFKKIDIIGVDESINEFSDIMEKVLDLCQSCYEDLKAKESIPKFLIPLFSLRNSLNPSKCVEEIKLNGIYRLENKLYAVGRYRDILKENDTLDNLKTLNSKDMANLLFYFLTEYFGVNLLGKMIYFEEEKDEFYFVRKGKIIKANGVIKSLLYTLFGEYVKKRAIEELFPMLRNISEMITEKEFKERKNPKRYLRFKNAILDTDNFELLDDINGYYFTYEIPIEIEYDYFSKLRNSQIDEKHFENTLFYDTFRGFYSKKDPILGEEYWEILEYCFGSSLIFAMNEKRRIFDIVGETNTGKSTLMTLFLKALGDFATAISHKHFKENYNWAFSFLYEDKGIGVLSENPDFTIENIGLLKSMTGESLIEIEQKHQKASQKEIMLRLFITSNELTSLNQYDEAFLSRLVLIETINPIKKKDRRLLLELEKPENMKKFSEWLLYCAWKYWKRGYIIPDEKDEEYNNYLLNKFLESKDFLKPFIEEMCEIGEEYRERREILHAAFNNFREQRGLPKISNQRFYEAMRVRYQEVKGKDGNWYFKGVKLKEEYTKQSSLT